MWTASDTVRLGDLYVGVRSYPANLSDLVGQRLAPYLVGDVEAPPNYSVRLEERRADSGAAPATYVLYRGQCRLLRTRKREIVLRALVRGLGSHVEPLDGLIRIRRSAVVGPAGAVVLPPELDLRIETLEPRLRARGVRVVDPPYVYIDVVTGELVPVPPALELDPSGPGEEGRHPIREWAVLTRDQEALTRHDALAAVLPTLDEGVSVADAMSAVLRALGTATVSATWYDRPERLLERISARA